ncbi:hypothetical protein Tco_0853237 [Tanacetum coccineum]
MVCGVRLALFSFIEVSKPSGSWDELVVSVQCFPSNPSLPLACYIISPFMGIVGLCVLATGKGYRGRVGFVCTMAEIGCNWARIGPSKSSQSLSILRFNLGKLFATFSNHILSSEDWNAFGLVEPLPRG